MHPEHHNDRRKATDKPLHKHYSGLQEIVLVDVGEYHCRVAFSIGLVTTKAEATQQKQVVACVQEAEEAAIVLGLHGTAAKIIFSDSLTAVMNFASGKIDKPALRILNKHPPPDRQIQIIVIPAHSSHPGNEPATNYAGGFAGRAVGGVDLCSAKDRMVTFLEITMHCQEGRQ